MLAARCPTSGHAAAVRSRSHVAVRAVKAAVVEREAPAVERAAPVATIAAIAALTAEPEPAAAQPAAASFLAAAAGGEAPAGGAAPSKEADIYIGFPKGDYAPRAGRKGRVIRDDPSRYPGKEDLGPLLGATGGWAGGEAGLWKLREQIAAEQAAEKEAAEPRRAVRATTRGGQRRVVVPRAQGGKAPIYVGYGKSDLELRKSGVPGRFILDDAAKYPGKEDVGAFAGATGGFAAGEKGLRQFLRDGELRLRRPGAPAPREASPLPVAGLLAAAGAGGGLLLNGAADFAEMGLRAEMLDVLNAPISESAKGAIIALALIAGGSGLAAAGRALALSLQERIAGGAQAVMATGGVWVTTFMAARAALEM